MCAGKSRVTDYIFKLLPKRKIRTQLTATDMLCFDQHGLRPIGMKFALTSRAIIGMNTNNSRGILDY